MTEKPNGSWTVYWMNRIFRRNWHVTIWGDSARPDGTFPVETVSQHYFYRNAARKSAEIEGTTVDYCHY